MVFVPLISWTADDRGSVVHFFFFTLVTGPRRSLSDTRVYEPQIRARLGTTAHFCEVVVLKWRAVPSCADLVFVSLISWTSDDRGSVVHPKPYRGTTLIRNRTPLGPYSRTMPRALW